MTDIKQNRVLDAIDTSTGYLIRIARGQVPGYSHVDKFGSNPAIASGTTEEVWDGIATLD